LVQIQDIAGCRVVVEGMTEQEKTVASLLQVFENVTVIDRRQTPSFGYRAVHLIVRVSGRPVEVQIRTLIQHYWAESSEKLSDADPAVKYGGGAPEVRDILDRWSRSAAAIEAAELKTIRAAALLAEIPEGPEREEALAYKATFDTLLAQFRKQLRDIFE
jgi:GTP pyrophosphokinase